MSSNEFHLNPSPSVSRRDLLKSAAYTGAGVLILPSASRAQGRSPNDKLNVGIIGVSGRGAASLEAVARTENVVALCDVDERSLDKAAQRFPIAAKFVDFRKMLERREIDAVTVSTPDHCHAAASIMAMRAGKHVYCEKPLTHSVFEARKMSEVAAATRVATQMGNQGHSNDGTRRVVELVQSGAVGPIREVHCWTDRPIWPQGINRPDDRPEVPSQVHWDLWLGPAPERPYHPAYHPFKWRGWWDFGTGALGDMACHVVDTAFWALKLGAPLTVEAEGEPRNAETAPVWSIIHYTFPAREGMPPVKLTWYDGKKLPPADLFEGQSIAENGTLLVGEKGKIYLPDPYGSSFKLLPEAQFKDFQPPAVTIANSTGHHAEWLAACKGGKPAGSNFVYSGPLTELVLLGNVAYRAGQKLEWDPVNLKATNCPEADRFLRREYRAGWSI